MRLSVKSIVSFANINQFSFGNQWTIRAGDPNTLYFQIVDLDQNGLRYIPGIGGLNQPASIIVTFPSIDDTQVINVSATQDPNDGSIWSLPITSVQTPSSGNVLFAITEGANTRRFSCLSLLSVEILNNGAC